MFIIQSFLIIKINYCNYKIIRIYSICDFHEMFVGTGNINNIQDI